MKQEYETPEVQLLRFRAEQDLAAIYNLDISEGGQGDHASVEDGDINWELPL